MKVTTMEELEALMLRLHPRPDGFKHVIDHSITAAASNLAEHLWITKTKESADTREFRRQLNHLNKTGVWAFVRGK